MGERVAALRNARRLDQTQLAKKIGVQPSAISMIEKGQTKSLSGKVLAGLCKHLESTPDFILEGAGSELVFERAMQLAELASLAAHLPPQALTALVDTARTVSRATVDAASPAMPFKTAPPIPQPPRPANAEASRKKAKS